MGQKVSPIGMRVGVIRDWQSRWYADDKEFGTLLMEDVKIRELVENLHDVNVVGKIPGDSTEKGISQENEQKRENLPEERKQIKNRRL